MTPTRTTVLLVCLGLVLLPAGVLWLGVPWLVLAYQLVVLALFGVDARWARRGPALEVRRERSAALSLGVANEVVLVVENFGPGTIPIRVRDEIPAEFRADATLLEAVVPPRGQVRLTYRVVPGERGDFSLGRVFLRQAGPLGLAWVDSSRPAAEPVRVYPNLLEIRRYEALVRSTLVRSGGYRAKRLPGAGREFSHFRDYTPDDDYRHVNWKATARRAKPVTAAFESEHSQDILFCLDTGRMMASRVGALTKLDHAINAILMLTHVSQTFQDNLGLLVFAHSVRLYLPPAKGRAQHAQFLQTLYHIRPEYGYVDYREAFQYLVGRHPKRALVMVFTDLLDNVVSAEYFEAMRLLRRFHLPLTLAVADVPLQRLAATAPDDLDAAYHVGVARDLLHGRAELLRNLERHGVAVLDTVPERLTVDAVNRYLALKTGAKI